MQPTTKLDVILRDNTTQELLKWLTDIYIIYETDDNWQEYMYVYLSTKKDEYIMHCCEYDAMYESIKEHAWITNGLVLWDYKICVNDMCKYGYDLIHIKVATWPKDYFSLS